MEENAEGRFVPNDLYLSRKVLPCCCSPARTWAANPPISVRPRCSSSWRRWAASSPPPACASVSWTASIPASAPATMSRGRSTFMVEMTRNRHHPQHRQEQSLILLDEMGRGTATFDGLSLAWATARIHPRPHRRRTLFATHYHELTLLASSSPPQQPARCRQGSPAGIAFLHTIEPAPPAKAMASTWRASPASPPRSSSGRAASLRSTKNRRNATSPSRPRTPPPLQLTIFTPLSQRILDRITDLDTNSLTPLQALNLLEELKTEIRAAETLTLRRATSRYHRCE